MGLKIPTWYLGSSADALPWQCSVFSVSCMMREANCHLQLFFQSLNSSPIIANWSQAAQRARQELQHCRRQSCNSMFCGTKRNYSSRLLE